MTTRIDGDRPKPLSLMTGQVPVTDDDLVRAAHELVIVLQGIVSRLSVTDLRPN